jgi:integrase/recombinase XerD
MVKVLCSFVRGPLEPYAAGFVEELFRQGYSRSGAEQHVCFIAHLDRWLSVEGLALADLSGLVVERFLVQRRATGYVQYLSVKALRPLLDHLGPLSVLPAAEPVRATPVEELLGRYRMYLLAERGLTVGTARGYVDCVRPFIKTRVRADVLDLAGVRAADVTGFVLAACPGRVIGSAQLIVCALRSLLGWLHLTGVTPTALATVVPSVAGWSLSGLPKGLEPGELRRLLAACDRGTSAGRRDYAIMLLLARLGLRAGEVAGLGLEDIDWRHGEVVVRGKGNRLEQLPLPSDVGAAITAYLRHGRPGTAQGRSVFVRVHAPHRALTTGGVTTVVFAAAGRAGLGKIRAHRLRHTAATAMLRAGSPLAEVGQVLRHRSALSTAIYAKVDRDALVVLARPWPVATSAGVS